MKRTVALGAIGAIVMLATAAHPPQPQEPDGAAVYQKQCRKCHGATGTPSARMAEMYPTMKPLTELAGTSADSIVTLLVNGTETMKTYKDKLTPEELQAVAEYTLALSKGEGS